jgi:hypothetical protein
MIAHGNRCAECDGAIDINRGVFRAAGGKGLRCHACQLRATCCSRLEGCDVKRLCGTMGACAAANPALVLELATRIAKLARPPETPPATSGYEAPRLRLVVGRTS